MSSKEKNVKNIPNLLFNNPKIDWKTAKFGSLVSFKTTNSYSRDNLNYELGVVKNIHYGDIHTKFQTLFDITNEDVPYINKEINIDKISEENYCLEGDMIFADASEDLNDVGKSIEIFELNNEKILSGLHTILARPNKGIFHKGFLGYAFKSENVRNQIKKESQGSKVLSINAGRLSKIEINYPDIVEQKKIADFFLLIDKKIQTQKKTIQNLKLSKSAFFRKILSKKLRFKKSNGGYFSEWKKMKLSEISNEHLDKNIKLKYEEVFSVAKHKGVINQIEHLGRSFAAREIRNYKVIYPGDLVYTKSPTSDFPFGIIKQNKTGRTGVVSPLYCVFTPQNYSLGFIIHEYFTSSVNTYNYLNPLVQKGAKNTMNINNDTFLNGDSILLPTDLEEQTKIANFLNIFDKKIQLETEILSKLEEQKRYFLQNLFV